MKLRGYTEEEIFDGRQVIRAWFLGFSRWEIWDWGSNMSEEDIVRAIHPMTPGSADAHARIRFLADLVHTLPWRFLGGFSKRTRRIDWVAARCMSRVMRADLADLEKETINAKDD